MCDNKKSLLLSAKRAASFIFLLLVLAGCGDSRNSQIPWREQTLPSGRVVKVVSFSLGLVMDHDDRIAAQDCFGLEFVAAQPQAEPPLREAEAREVFELIRPVSEQWGFKQATLVGYPSAERHRPYDQFVFDRGADGRWTCTRTSF